jgi:hypothetical protein
MLDFAQLQQKFKHLPFEEKFQQLFAIFSHIREKINTVHIFIR